MRMQNGYVTRKAGKWRGHFWRYTVDALTGEKKRSQKCVTFDADVRTKTKAKEELRKLLVHELGLSADSGMTVRGFITQRWQPLKESRWKPSTAQTNKELLTIITDRWADVPLRKVDNVALQVWLNESAKKRSSSAIKHLRIFLRSIFAEALAERRVDRDPARLLILPRMRPVKRNFLEMAEVKALLKASMPLGTIPTRDTCLLRLALTTGLRPSEIFAMRWRDVNLTDGTITIEQTVYKGKLRDYAKTEGSAGQLAIPPEAVDALTRQLALAQDAEKFCKPDDYVFPTSTGTFWLKENYQRRVLTPLAEQAGIKGKAVNFQTLRRTTATHALDYANLRTVQEVMRHRSSETTMRNYVQVVSGAAREAVNGLSAAMTPEKEGQQ